MDKTVVIRFFAPVNQQTINALISVVESKLKENTKNIKLLISSAGGDVFSGISAYNYLKGIPASIETYNFGSVDSIAGVIYCAGTKRYSVPNARFLIHGISWSSQGPISFEEKKIKELEQGLKIDRENIAKILSDNCNKKQEEIEKIMFEGKTFNPTEAKELGLVHNIVSDIIKEGDDVIGIG